jgi:hypothetical protein
MISDFVNKRLGLFIFINLFIMVFGPLAAFADINGNASCNAKDKSGQPLPPIWAVGTDDGGGPIRGRAPDGSPVPTLTPCGSTCPTFPQYICTMQKFDGKYSYTLTRCVSPTTQIQIDTAPEVYKHGAVKYTPPSKSNDHLSYHPMDYTYGDCVDRAIADSKGLTPGMPLPAPSYHQAPTPAPTQEPGAQ